MTFDIEYTYFSDETIVVIALEPEPAGESTMFLEKLMTEFGENLIDVIREVKNVAGQTSFVCEIAALEARHVKSMTLVDVARQWFGHGRLRKIGDGMFAVLRPAPVAQKQPPFVVRPIRTGPAPVFPTWAYFV